MHQALQLTGALLVLAGFIAAQRQALSPSSPAYLALNLVGSAVLAGVAWSSRDWGFLLLEAVWALVSLWGLVQLCRRDLQAGAAVAGPDDAR